MIFLVSKENPWSRRLYSKISKEIECRWYTDETYRADMDILQPSWSFFFHWSKIVPADTFESHRCVVFHTGNLPTCRGGSPLQNQILEGIVESRVNAIEMSDEIDGGGVYASLPITLQGTIEDVWMTISDLSARLITKCVFTSPQPSPQVGTPHTYKRNKNNILPLGNTDDILDLHRFIQMLDSENYPNAFVDFGKFRLKFSRSQLRNGEIIADVKIRKIDNE